MKMRHLVMAAAALALGSSAFAAPFTAGNIVVLRVGDGSGALTNGGWPVFLDEFSPTTPGQAVPIQTIAIPTTTSGSNRRLVINGTSATEGFLDLSENGQYLVIVGYDAATGGANVQQQSVDRVIARIDMNGNVDSSTTLASAASYTGSNIRSAATVDGTAYWTAGTSTGSTGGVWHVVHGATSGTKIDTINNVRTVDIFGGKLYSMSASNPNQGLNTYDTNLPTTTSNTTNLMPGWSGTDIYGFEFLAANLVFSAENTLGLQRWAESAGTWSLTTVDAGRVRDVTGKKNGNDITLYVTSVNTNTGNAANDLKRWVSTDNGMTGAYTTLATAPTNTSYRGVITIPDPASVPEWSLY